MDIAVGTCPVCRGAARHLLDVCDRNWATTDESFPYDRCASCKAVFIRAVPADLARYYRDDYYQFDHAGEPSWRREPQRLATSAYRLALLKRYVAGGHLIEIGAGTGAFCVPARDAGFSVSAIEMSAACCEYLGRQRQITALRSDDPLAVLATLEEASAIVLWHVLEHLADPALLIDLAAHKLAPGGVLALATPNPLSLQFKLLKGRWMHLDAPRHLRLLAPDAIAEIASRHGLREVERTSSDPNGTECNLIGWINALHRPPALRGGSWLSGQLGGLLWRLASPIENRGDRGSAATILLQRS
jgi:2-polyprenyl-3-methyl-5-hydroxy-6-metoxy-1,4-benzoquinol methylase